jgi:glycosyltransferase involved in cell wall biosynthesis
MKIAILTNDYPPHATGGAGVVAEIQAHELERRGHEVKVVHHAPTFTKRSVLARLFGHLGDLGTNKKIVEDILSWKPDILLTQNLTGCGIGTPRAIRHQGIPWVHVLHDVQLIDPSGRIVAGERLAFLRAPWRWLWSHLRKSVMGTPDHVVSPTRWLLEMHRWYGLLRASRSDVIPNPLVVPEGERAPWESRESSMLFVGRVDADKGIDVLLRAWKSMGDDRPRFDVVGEGARSSDLAALKDDRLVLHGRIPHERIFSLMQQSRVVVVPSLVAENQPTVALEGLAAGCNVIGSDVGGMSETLKNAGRIVPPNRPDALRDAIRLALADPPSADVVRGILEPHRVEVVVDALEGVLVSNR